MTTISLSASSEQDVRKNRNTNVIIKKDKTEEKEADVKDEKQDKNFLCTKFIIIIYI